MVVRSYLNVLYAIRDAVGIHFPISMRISQWKLGNFNSHEADTPQELEKFIIPLVNAGVDIIHYSTQKFFIPEYKDSPLTFVGWVKKIIR